MEWSSKQKQQIDYLVEKATKSINNIAFIAHSNPHASSETINENHDDAVGALNKLHDSIISLGQAFQAQREAVRNTVFDMVDKIGENDKPEPVKPVKPKPDPRIFVWGAVISLLLGYLIPSLVWWNWNNWQPEMMITGYISFMATFAVFFMWGLSKRINQVADWEMKNSSGGHP